MAQVSLRVGQKVYIIDKLEVFEGEIKNFVSDKSWEVRYRGYTDIKKKGYKTELLKYGIDVFLSRQKAEKVIEGIRENANKCEPIDDNSFKQATVCEACGLPISSYNGKCGCSYDK